MYDVYFDSGTTNTRMYIVDGAGSVVFKTEKAVGSKDAALANDRSLLARELYALYVSMLAEKSLSDADIRNVWMSGMVSCPSGIVEIPHICVPAGIQKLAESVCAYDENRFFKRTILFIPGVKSVPFETEITFSNVDAINNMRGEETEIMGIMSRITVPDTCVFILPGSHTQIAVVKNHEITNIVSTITGELFKAIKSETILSASLEGSSSGIDASMVRLGYKNLITYGFNRAIYITRALHLFTDSTDGDRRSYVEGVLNGGVLQALHAAIGDAHFDVFVCGSAFQYDILKAIADEYYPAYALKKIENDSALPFSVAGYKALSRAYESLFFR